jgi:hypothetical protein
MTMNFFYDLPDEIQEKIYHEAHKINSKDLFKEIKTIDFWNRDDTCYAILEMTKLLYKLDATQEERGDYYYCLDWIDGKRLNITMEDIFENKYYRMYYDYWDAYTARVYYNGDYI